MILGSHNTMTYLKPAKWWMWFGRFIAKCQKLDYKKQYEVGVRFFDLRISLTTDYNGFYQPIFSHGLCDYKNSNICEVLDFLNSKPDVIVRFLFEKGDDKEKEIFKNLVLDWMKEYPNLKIIYVKDKRTWKDIVEPNYVSPYPLVDLYASNNGNYPQYSKLPGILKNKTNSGLLIDDLWPWIYAKFNNKKNLDKYKDQDVILMIDFVK